MKRLLLIFTLFTLVWACKKDDEKIGPGPGDFYLDLSKESVLAWDTLTYVKIDVSTNGEFWDVKEDKNAPWCEPSMNDTKADRSITLRIAPNQDAGERQAVIQVYGEDDIVKTIEVKQMGTDPVIIYFAADLDKISDDSVRLIVDVQANMEYEVIIPEAYRSWLAWAGTEEGDKIRNYFTVSRNLGEPRDGMIVLKGIEHPEVQKEISLRQVAYDPAYVSVDPGNIGAVKDIKIKIVSATTTSQQSVEPITAIYDGSYTSIWHSAWNAANTAYPITVVLNLEANERNLDYVMYYPRSPRNNGTLGEASVYYSTMDDPENFKLYGEYDFGMLADVKKLLPPEEIVAPAKLKWVIRSGVGGFGSIAEVEAWQLAPEDTSITGVFTDETYSALKEGVTYEMITRISEPFLFNIAKYLLTGDYPVADRVREYRSYRHPDNVAKGLKTSPYSLYDNPTGISFRPMDDVVVFVGATNGEEVKIRIANPMNGSLQEESFALKEGENKVTSRYGGLGYIEYFTENSKAQPIKVHVASGSVNGLFDVTKHTDEDWQQILNNATFQALDVVGRKMHLLFEVEDWKSINNPEELIEAWDQIVAWEQELMGLEKYSERMPTNRIFGFVDHNPSAYMYATNYKTGYAKKTIQELVVASNIRGGSVWGPAHEIGHVNQVRPGMKWVGLGEVSNNIYSLYIQTKFGNVSRLTAEKRYEQAFSELMLSKVAHGAVSDPFVKLVPFWQLQVYSQAIGKLDYYPDLFEYIRKFSDKTAHGEMQLDFVKYTCQLLELNLIEFFEAWGFLTPIKQNIDDYGVALLEITTAQISTLKTEIAGYGNPVALSVVPYLTDNNIAFLKNKANVVAGTATVGQNVTMTGWQNVMVYKVYDGTGKVVYISPDSSFATPEALATVKAVQWDGMEIEVTF